MSKKKTYVVVITKLGVCNDPELKLGNDTFERGAANKVSTAYGKEVVGYKEARNCLRLALCNAQRQGVPGVGGAVIDVEKSLNRKE